MVSCGTGDSKLAIWNSSFFVVLPFGTPDHLFAARRRLQNFHSNVFTHDRLRLHCLSSASRVFDVNSVKIVGTLGIDCRCFCMIALAPLRQEYVHSPTEASLHVLFKRISAHQHFYT